MRLHVPLRGNICPASSGFTGSHVLLLAITLFEVTAFVFRGFTLIVKYPGTGLSVFKNCVKKGSPGNLNTTCFR